MAQPEIEFLGRAAAPGSHHVSDPAVNAAFMAFHRNSARLAAGSPAKRRINRGAVALVALTVLGFGGGLSLAFFSFNGAETPRGSVASRAPEIIYTPPATADTPAQPGTVPLYDVSGEAGLFASSSSFQLRAEDEPAPETSVWRDMSPRGGLGFNGTYSDNGTPTFALSGEQGFSAAPLSDATAGGVTSDFGALTAAPVPEPSTWATMISGAGLLMIFGKFKRRGS
jgi:hypothetical protein